MNVGRYLLTGNRVLSHDMSNIDSDNNPKLWAVVLGANNKHQFSGGLYNAVGVKGGPTMMCVW